MISESPTWTCVFIFKLLPGAVVMPKDHLAEGD